MVMVKGFCADWGGLLESVTCTVKLATTFAVGVPVMAPVAAINAEIGGKRAAENTPCKGTVTSGFGNGLAIDRADASVGQRSCGDRRRGRQVDQDAESLRGALRRIAGIGDFEGKARSAVST